MTEENDVTMTPKQVADMLFVSQRTLANWRSLRKGPRYVHIGGSGRGVGGTVLYMRSDVMEFLRERTVETTPKGRE